MRSSLCAAMMKLTMSDFLFSGSARGDCKKLTRLADISDDLVATGFVFIPCESKPAIATDGFMQSALTPAEQHRLQPVEAIVHEQFVDGVQRHTLMRRATEAIECIVDAVRVAFQFVRSRPLRGQCIRLRELCRHVEHSLCVHQNSLHSLARCAKVAIVFTDAWLLRIAIHLCFEFTLPSAFHNAPSIAERTLTVGGMSSR